MYIHAHMYIYIYTLCLQLILLLSLLLLSYCYYYIYIYVYIYIYNYDYLQLYICYVMLCYVVRIIDDVCLYGSLCAFSFCECEISHAGTHIHRTNLSLPTCLHLTQSSLTKPRILSLNLNLIT